MFHPGITPYELYPYEIRIKDYSSINEFIESSKMVS
jgi:hypothetical protein